MGSALTWADVRRRRLARNRLAERAPRERLLETVGAVGGIQAQVMSAAELALGVRVSGLTQHEVREELWERRGLVKSYTLRGTLHLVPAAELPLWIAAMRARPYWHEERWREELGVQADAFLEAISDALDGRCLTRAELAAEVAARVGPWAKERLSSTWGELLGPAVYTGRLCVGPPQGARVTFVRADQWIGGWDEPDPYEALAEVLRRYLRAYGPATPGD